MVFTHDLKINSINAWFKIKPIKLISKKKIKHVELNKQIFTLLFCSGYILCLKNLEKLTLISASSTSSSFTADWMDDVDSAEVSSFSSPLVTPPTFLLK